MTPKLVPENVVIADSTVLINFVESGQFGLLLRVFEGRLHITDVVKGEIRRTQRPLLEAIRSGRIVVHPTDLQTLQRVATLSPSFDVGEASCLLLAERYSWRVATDDGAAKAYIGQRLGPTYVLTTFDILLEAHRLRYISDAKAREILTAMTERANFQYSDRSLKNFIRSL